MRFNPHRDTKLVVDTFGRREYASTGSVQAETSAPGEEIFYLPSFWLRTRSATFRASARLTYRERGRHAA